MDPTLMQLQLRHNADELQDYLKGLESWERDIKEKDQTLTKQKPTLKERLPPVRSQATVEAATTKSNGSVQKRKKKKKRKLEGSNEVSTKSRIKSFDYKAWDKFNVDEACEEVDYRVHSSSSTSSEEEEDDDEQQRKQQAVLEKEKGNTHFKNREYKCAVECYGRAMQLDPSSPIMPANRAMALIKLGKFEEAESDCSLALSLDGSYIKAFLRRATARHQLGRLCEAKEDFNRVLKLEPSNKLAKVEILKIEQEIESSKPKDKKTVSIVYRPPHLRSKKPLKRITIEDIGGDSIPELNDHTNNQSTLEQQPTNVYNSATTSAMEGTQTVISRKEISMREETLEQEHVGVTKTKQTVENNEDSIARDSLDPVAENKTPSTTDKPSDITSCNDKKELVNDVAKTMVSLVVPDVPDTSLQFQADWKRARRDKAVLTKYFKSLPLSKYPALLQQSLETDVFPELISILHKDYVSCGVCCLNELEAISKVKRFTVAIMFLSKKQQQGLHQLFRDLKELVVNDSECAMQVTLLAKKYNVSL